MTFPPGFPPTRLRVTLAVVLALSVLDMPDASTGNNTSLSDPVPLFPLLKELFPKLSSSKDDASSLWLLVILLLPPSNERPSLVVSSCMKLSCGAAAVRFRVLSFLRACRRAFISSSHPSTFVDKYGS